MEDDIVLEDRLEPRPSGLGPNALNRGLALLDIIANAPRPPRFTEIMYQANMPKGTLYRMLQPLLDYRLIRLQERDQTYHLGNRLFEMAHKVWSEFDIRGAAEPELSRLRALSGETTLLGVIENRAVLIVGERDCDQPLRISLSVGSKLDPLTSAVGKALIAYMPPARLAEFMTPSATVNLDAISRELTLGRARGYAVSISEDFAGVSSVAAPILDHRGEAIAAIGIAGPSLRLDPDRLHALGRDVIEAARRISSYVGETYMTISTTVAPAAKQDRRLKCVVPSAAFLGEGPVWLPSSNTLMWVDILSPAVHASDVTTGETRTRPMAELIGSIAPRKDGGFVVASQSRLELYNSDFEQPQTVAAPVSMAGHRFNDGKCDAKGRFWVGSIGLDVTPGEGSLFCLDTDGRLRVVETGFDLCNGMGWSPDSSRFYFVDSGKRVIYAYDFDLEAGTISNRITLVEFEPGTGNPDGLAVDADGFIWCAMWDGWCVQRFSPEGHLDRSITVPVPRPTSCAFGGEDLRTLFITSARIRLSAMQLAAAPLSGSVFAIDAATPGSPIAAFAG
ncbi:SMP-30/gluconolactonase/LRE family protein [Brevundimonas aurifodinae]|uniref:SMP-30/gluconolactonase/LRE family protein n=1 Tax=Brevundimonas aurifodinae TaxID=1508312 RepID=A0ABV1NNG2_9CAUL